MYCVDVQVQVQVEVKGRNVSDKEAVSVALAEKGHLVIYFELPVVVVRVIQSHPTTGLTLMKSIRVQGYIATMETRKGSEYLRSQ